MNKLNTIHPPSEFNLKKIIDLVLRNYKKFIFSVIIVVGLAYVMNRLTIPAYEVSASMLIKQDSKRGGGDKADYMNSGLFDEYQNFQNELWVLKSAPVIEQTIRNLNLTVRYFRKKEYLTMDAYGEVPFRVMFSPKHLQPINTRFVITFLGNGNFELKSESKEVPIYDYEKEEVRIKKENWNFQKRGKYGKLIETADLSFIVVQDSAFQDIDKEAVYSFEFSTVASLVDEINQAANFSLISGNGTVIKVIMRTQSIKKGVDIINGIMDVYSQQNLERKNHIANISIDYIEKQLSEISDSLNMTENSLQSFKASRQLLNVEEQANSISNLYLELQNKLAELDTRKKYYDYVADYIANNNELVNVIIPASIGIADPLLNSLMSSLIDAQAQRSNLLANKQDKSPLVKKLDIQIENFKTTISDNISSLRRTTDISMEDMRKRIGQISAQISSMPGTQRTLGGIERKYRLNDAIYNYLLEKRAEAQITKASNLPDNIILESARQEGVNPISPNTKKNYLIAMFLGFVLPLVFVIIKNLIINKIETQEDIEGITDTPVIGKILHSNKKTNNVVFEFPKSNITESYRSLRTNMDFYLRGANKGTILVTSSIQGEGKTFNALNIAMSFAQLGRRTILVDFDLRKRTSYFIDQPDNQEGLSTYLINKVSLENIINKSTHEKLDYINSGPLPPNPAELMALAETVKLIEKLKTEYDYVILDTPPLAQVTDGYLIINQADLILLLVRCNYSKKRILSIVLRELNQKSVKNFYLLMNDNRVNNDQYGYGYGYYKKGKK